MNTAQMRVELAKAYVSSRWQERVKKMNDDQVQAIYLRLKAQGKL